MILPFSYTEMIPTTNETLTIGQTLQPCMVHATNHTCGHTHTLQQTTIQPLSQNIPHPTTRQYHQLLPPHLPTVIPTPTISTLKRYTQTSLGRIPKPPTWQPTTPTITHHNPVTNTPPFTTINTIYLLIHPHAQEYISTIYHWNRAGFPLSMFPPHVNKIFSVSAGLLYYTKWICGLIVRDNSIK